MSAFPTYPRTPRLDKPMIVTEKIDGTNSTVAIYHQDDVTVEVADYIVGQHGDLCVFAGSRRRWITPDADNYGFAGWVAEHAKPLAERLGQGLHRGEWWGHRIQRGYGQDRKRWSLFRVDRYVTQPDGLWDVVPVITEREFNTASVKAAARWLADNGSLAAPGWDRPEGVVAYHTGAGQPFKYLIDKG